jgi:hypothetical protein
MANTSRQSATGVTKREITVNAWGQALVVPAETRVHYVAGGTGGWVVSDAAWIKKATGNTHDPEYRYLWINEDEVVVPAPTTPTPCRIVWYRGDAILTDLYSYETRVQEDIHLLLAGDVMHEKARFRIGDRLEIVDR